MIEKTEDTGVEFEVGDKLIGELRGQVNDLLAAVQLLTPLVRERGEARDAECLAAMNKSLYRLIRTVYHLELCQGEEHAFCPQVTDVAGLCRDLGRQVESLAEELGIGFDWTLGKESVLALADGELLERAVLNLLTNAFTAAGKGGKVTLRCAVSGGRFTVTVTDNGPGLRLPGEEADPYLKKDGGVGLGLAAARRVAALHGGALVLENAGEGVRAVLSLPIRMPDKSEEVHQSRMPYDHSGGFSTLLVEFSPLLPARDFLPENVE